MTLDRFDPTMTRPDQVHTELRTGQIIYAIPAVNVYRVDVEGVSGIQEAYYSGTFGGSLDWTRNGITLTPGSRVKVNVPIQRDGSAYSRALAEIISVNPFYNKAPATDDSGDDITFTPRTLTRWLFPASSQHILEEGDWGKYSVARGWNVGTREDAVAGEWSQSTSSGSILRVNPLEAAVKACEQAGVEAHRIDKMLRMVGFNLEMMSGGALERRLSDRGEYSSIRAEVPYLWEAPGGLSEGDWSDDVPRHVTLTGHAGDLRTETIQLPPAENDSPAMRVLTEQMSWDGGYYLEGAGEIMMGRARPAEPITLERFLCNYMPERPAGGVPGDEYDGSGDAPPEPPGDWSFTGAITVDGTDYTPPPADESDPSGLDMGNFSAYAIGKQTAHRREQRLRALAQNIACDLGDEVTLNESGQITVEGADHRSDAQLYLPGEQEAFWKWTSGSTWVLKNGETEMVVGPYTSQFYGNKELATFARVNCMGGDVVNMHSRYRTNVRAMDVLVQPRQSAIVNNLVRGEWTPSQSVSNWVNGGVTLYEWADGGWNQIGSASASGHVGSVDIKVSELSDPVDGTDPLTGPVKACVGGTDHYLEGFLKGSGAGVSYSVDIVDVTPAEPNLDYDSCSKDIDVKVQVYTGPDDDRTPVEEADVVLTSEGIEFEDAEPVAATDAEGYVTFTVTITQWGDMRLRAESRGGEAFHSLTVTADDGCKEPDYWDLAAEITSQPADGNISCDPYVATVQVEAEAELYAHSGATTPEQTRTDDVWVSMWVEPNYCDSITSPQAVDEEGRASFDVGLARADVYTAHVLVTDEATGLSRVLVSNPFTVTKDDACTPVILDLHSTDGTSISGTATHPDGATTTLTEGTFQLPTGSSVELSGTLEDPDHWLGRFWQGDVAEDSDEDDPLTFTLDSNRSITLVAEPLWWDLSLDIDSGPSDIYVSPSNSCSGDGSSVSVSAYAKSYPRSDPSGAGTPESTRYSNIMVLLSVEPGKLESGSHVQSVDASGNATLDFNITEEGVYSVAVTAVDTQTGKAVTRDAGALTVTVDDACKREWHAVDLHSTDGGEVSGSGLGPDGDALTLYEGTTMVEEGSTLDFSHLAAGLDDDGIGKILEWTFQQWEGDYDDSTVTVTGPISVTGVFGLEPPDAVDDDDIIVYNSSSDEWEHKSTPSGDGILMHNGGSLTWSVPPGTGDYIPVSVDGDIQWMEINDADCSTM